MSFPVQVALRIRPTSTDASLPHRPLVLGVVQGHPTQVTLSTPSHHYTNNLNSSGGRCFTFDHVFDQPTLQEHLYNRVCRSLVEQFLDGFNVTILAYGQTSSGKTFTMGSAEPDQNHLRGIIPRVIQQIFESPQTSDPSSFNLKVSFVEIYQEQLRDLLSGEGENREIAIREDRTGAINLSGVSEPQIRSADDALKFVRTGSQARTTGDTQMHLYSSRSHAIFTLTLQQRCPKSDTDGSSKILKYSKIHLVDLAGSERAKRTGAEGLRFKESIKINSGLLALGNVISILGGDRPSSEAADRHIPYRDSKLTRLLQDSLGGNAKTLMIACVSPLEDDYEETLNTLKYAYRARRIQNKPIINQLQEESSKIQDMQSKIDQLESMMKAYSSESTEGTGPAIAPAAEGDPGHPKIRALRPASATEELDDLDNESWMAVFVQEAKKRTSKAARAYRELIAARRTIQDERARTRQLEEHLMKLKAEQADTQFQLESLATEHNRLSDQMSAINAELEELIDPLDVVLRGMLWDDEQQDIVVRFLTHRRPSAYGTATAHDGTDLEHRSVRRIPRPQTHLAGSPAPTVLRTRHSSAHQRDEECEKQKLEVLRLEDELLESSKVIKSLKDEIQVLKMQFIAEETLCQARSTMLEKMERRNKEQRLEIDALRDRVAQLESLDRSLERQFDVRRPKTMASINYRDERGLRMQMGDPDDARLSEDQLRSIADQRSSRAESRHDVEDAEGAESVGGQAKTMAASAGFRAETASVGVDADQAGEDPDNDSQRELNIAMKAKVDAVKDLSRMGKEMDKLKSQFTEKSMRLEKHIEALSRDNAKLDKDLADLEQIKERQKDEYERKIKQLETQIYKLRNKKKEGDRLSKDKESLEKRISDLQQEVERAGSSHSLLKKKLKDDQDKLSDMEQRLGKETAALNKQHEDDMKKIRHLEVQYEMCRKKLDRKTEEIAVLVKKIKDGALMGGTKPREKFAATVADGSSPVPPKEGGGNQEPPANTTETANKSIKLSDADVEELRRDLGHLNGSKELIASLSDQPECDRIKAWTAFVSRVTKSPENAESTTQTESWAEIFEIPFAAIQKDLYFYRQTSKDLKAKLREVVAINQRLTGAPEHTKSISAAC